MTLRQFSKRWFKLGHTLQVAAFASFIGSQTTLAQYVPDSASNQPIWQSEEPEPESGADWSDHDLDGLPAWYESWLGTDPVLYDTDYDGINDGDEVATTGTNPLSWDTDGNGQSDLTDFYTANPPPEPEGSTSTDEPLAPDSDGISDSTEATEGTDPTTVDTDGDGLTDGEETNIFNTDPNNPNSLSSQYTDWHMVDLTDTDGGGVPDRIEQYHGLNIYDANDDVNGDLDGDGVTNTESYENGTDLDANVTETYDRDGDGMTDVWEVSYGLNPDDAGDASGDPDGDGANNLEEYQRGTNPFVSDYTPPEEEEEETIINEEPAEEPEVVQEQTTEEPEVEEEDTNFLTDFGSGCAGLGGLLILVPIPPIQYAGYVLTAIGVIATGAGVIVETIP